MQLNERLAIVETEIESIRREIVLRSQTDQTATELENQNRRLRDSQQNEFRGSLSDLSNQKVDITTFNVVIQRLQEKIDAKTNQQVIAFISAALSLLIAAVSIAIQLT